MARTSSLKGDRLENRLATALSVWLSRHLQEDYRPHFRNEPSSGANAANATRRAPLPGYGAITPASIGVADVHPLTPEAHELLNTVAFECKNYSTLEWGRLIFTPDSLTSTNTIKFQHEHHRKLCAHYRVIPIMVYNETQIKSGEPVLLIPVPVSRRLMKAVPGVEEAYLATFKSVKSDVLRMTTVLHTCPYSDFINVFTTYKDEFYANDL